eukprot:TRINITY_DN30245_c0_g1_i1.p1 TRINITY_DN30245_c0_g1~~TRINITY_DN30245_c0_g1_i1.p1  ORF type:complete len:537 (-),score=55.44 TRINITY_DN30245_c0_g1_i1:160-1770(-)
MLNNFVYDFAIVICLSTSAIASDSPWLSRWAEFSKDGSVSTALSESTLATDATRLLNRFAADASGLTVPRLKADALNASDFARYVRHGQPLVLSGFARGWPMADWTCDSIARDFGDEQVMLWDYGEGKFSDAKGKRLPKYMKLKTRQWFAGYDASPPPRVGASRLPERPVRPSYHWHPYTWFGGGSADDKDPSLRWHQNEPLATRASQERIKESYLFPQHLLPNSATNTRSFKDRIELFLGPPGSGADLHVDSVCEPILSVQICGHKHWWLAPMPPYNHSQREHTKQFWRTQASQGQSPPMWEVEVGPGDALLFPTGVAHHTEATGDGCSVSVSLQFRHPFAVQFIRDFASRLMFSAENSFCFVEVWSMFLTGYYRGFVRLQKAVQRKAKKRSLADDAVLAFVDSEIAAMFAAIDRDGGGDVSLREIKSHIQNEVQAMQQVDEELVEFDVEHEAEDWMACHDLDEDAKVSRSEYTQTLRELGSLYVRAQAEGACDEGCDTPLPATKNTKARRKHPVDAYPGAQFDRWQKRWGHTEL